MPPVRIVFYRNSRGRLPALDWLRELRQRDPELYACAAAALLELGASGRALALPLCEHHGNGLYALRPQARRPCAPILCFFQDDLAVALGPLSRPDGPVPMATLVRASRQRREFERDPLGHSHEEAPDLEAL